MASESHILAQSNPSASTLTDMLTVDRQATVRKVTICNQDTVAALVRLAIAPGGAANAASQYIVYDETLGPSRTLEIDFPGDGIRLGAGSIIRGRADSASVSFNVFGV